MTGGAGARAGRVVVIGVGNPYRCDDAVGPRVARTLRTLLPGVTVVECDGEPAGLIQAWRGARLAIVVDAVRARPARPGTVHRITLDATPSWRESGTSSHGLGFGAAVELARALDALPDRLVVYAVEAADVGFGTRLSAEVERAVPAVVDAVLAEVAAATEAVTPATPRTTPGSATPSAARPGRTEPGHVP